MKEFLKVFLTSVFFGIIAVAIATTIGTTINYFGVNDFIMIAVSIWLSLYLTFVIFRNYTYWKGKKIMA